MSRPFTHDWDQLPVVYSSQAWLSKVTGIKIAAIAKYLRRAGKVSALSPFAQRRFGAYASTMRWWVEAWGVERVLAFLDQHDADAALVLRSGLDKLDNEDADRIHSHRRHEEAKRQRAKERKGYRAHYTERLVSVLATQPLGLVPAATIASIAGVTHSVIKLYMTKNGIAPFSESGVGFPHAIGSWDKIVSAWGLDRTREWVTNYRPQLMTWFDRRAFPAAKRQEVTSAPLGCLPDGVIGAICNVTSGFVRDIRSEKGIRHYASTGIGSFPHAEGSFTRLVRELGRDAARAWLAERAPQYLDVFDHDTTRTPKPKPVAVAKPTKPATHKQKPGKAWRANHAQVIAMNTLVNAAKEREEARAKLRPTVTPGFGTWPDEDPKDVERKRISDAMAEYLARGGRITRLVGAGSPGVGQILEVREFGGVDA